MEAPQTKDAGSRGGVAGRGEGADMRTTFLGDWPGVRGSSCTGVFVPWMTPRFRFAVEGPGRDADRKT
ncbi:hypothetical protein GCM10023205_49210 [Yinghuangia aomiensis]|uniref:Uncharacterized protein n=1 Tax=Yinghuangia aomiensis TaxID=676205 RepID=A0ABP9HQI1_9ACTN